MLDASAAALVVLGESQLQQKLQQAVTHAVQQYETQAQIDAKEFDQALAQLANQPQSDIGANTSPTT
jgi:hypothetical protein